MGVAVVTVRVIVLCAMGVSALMLMLVVMVMVMVMRMLVLSPVAVLVPVLMAVMLVLRRLCVRPFIFHSRDCPSVDRMSAGAKARGTTRPPRVPSPAMLLLRPEQSPEPVQTTRR